MVLSPTVATTPPIRTRLRTPLPGLAFCAVGAAAALGIARLSGISPLLIAIVLGATITNFFALPSFTAPGIAVASKRLLRVGVALLGLQLLLSDVLGLGWGVLALAAAVVVGGIAGTMAVGRLLGMEWGERLLIACGFSICGAAAVAAVEGVTAARKQHVVTAVALAFIGGAALLSYTRSRDVDPGLTTEVALVTVFLLGALSVTEPVLGAGLGVAVASLLALRTEIHRFARSVITEDELHDLLLLAAAATIVLPLLPDRAVGPYDTLNPFDVWLLVVLVMAIGGGGYVAIRMVGQRAGLPLAPGLRSRTTLFAAGGAAGFCMSTTRFGCSAGTGSGGGGTGFASGIWALAAAVVAGTTTSGRTSSSGTTRIRGSRPSRKCRRPPTGASTTRRSSASPMESSCGSVTTKWPTLRSRAPGAGRSGRATTRTS